MPTVILLDVSLSMYQPAELADTRETVSKLSLAVHGINCLLDHFSANCKLEFVAMVTFSSICETISTFTRDFDSIREKLKKVEVKDKTSLETALKYVCDLVLTEWGNSTPCQVILITDGSPGFGQSSLKHSLSTLSQRDQSSLFPLPFPFPSKLFVMCIGCMEDPAVRAGISYYHKLVELAGLDSTMHVPDIPLSLKGIRSIFDRVIHIHFSPFHSTLSCGNLRSDVVLWPTPQPYYKIKDFESMRRRISNVIEVLGFLDLTDIGSPMAVSRHLILPYPEKREGLSLSVKCAMFTETLVDLDSQSEAATLDRKTNLSVRIKTEPHYSGTRMQHGIKVEPGLKMDSGLATGIKIEPGLETGIKVEPGLMTNIKVEPGLTTSIKIEPGLANNIKTEPGLTTGIKVEPGLSGMGSSGMRGDYDSSGTKLEMETEDETFVDEGKAPSFCVLLHGALKVENMAALCLLHENWFGLVYSWADSKKKSNLMLSVLEPGSKPVPWLGNLYNLGTVEDFVANNPPNTPVPAFPVRPSEKRSYSQTSFAWIREAGIQSDIQKILRHARRLPEKLIQFYKELNRVRKAALAIGFIELMDGMAAIFERECTLLPGTSHPDCAFQLTYVAGILRKPQGKDIKLCITPLKTKFGSETS